MKGRGVASYPIFKKKEMKIKYLTTMAGVNHVRQKGDIEELSEAEALRLLEAGFAELVEAEVKPPAKKRTTRKTKK